MPHGVLRSQDPLPPLLLPLPTKSPDLKKSPPPPRNNFAAETNKCHYENFVLTFVVVRGDYYECALLIKIVYSKIGILK